MPVAFAAALSSALGGLADSLTPHAAALALRAMGLSCRLRPALRERLSVRPPGGEPGSFDAVIQFTTRDRRSRAWVRFAGGRTKAGTGDAPVPPDVTVTLRDERYMRRFFAPSGGADLFGWLLDNHLSFDGNLAVLAKFGLIASAVALGGRPRPRPAGKPWPTDGDPDWRRLRARPPGRPCVVPPRDAGAPLLDDPAFASMTLDDFPRIKRLLHRHLTTRPRICIERARLWTEVAVRERRDGSGDPPVLRQARTFAHVLRNRRAVILDDDLLAGTTTSHPVGVIVFPEMGGTAIWPELLTVGARDLNPYEISDDDARALDREIFPCWLRENVREWARAAFGNPECLRLDERWVLYFLWKNHAVSHTIADMPSVLSRGLGAIAAEAREREARAADPARRAFHRSVVICIEAVLDYARRLAEEAEAAARTEGDAARRADLPEMARVCRKVPAGPAGTLREALNSIWICFLSLHQENMNAGLSIGRLDAWLQPYFEADVRRAEAAGGLDARTRAVREAIETTCAFMLKATDHLPLTPDVGNRLFGGSSSDQVITLGGVRPDGESAVCDMTYVFLKATEMLGLRDPNMNARCHPDRNPDYYLRRLCEVNLLTRATPSIHNDQAVIAALERQGFATEDARDWGATGCVEPTVCGRHMGHTNSMMFSMVAPLEMALRDGRHPLLEEQVGPRTGDPRTFLRWEEFLDAYERQLGWLIDRAAEANDLLGRAHQALHPTPFLSALVAGTAESGRDVIDGGARYNSSGVAMVGLADVVDSLSAVRTLVYDRRTVAMERLLDALDADFAGHEALHAEIAGRVPRFGSGDPVPTAIAADLVDFVFENWQAHRNYRGGRYLPGYWSMSNHVAFGLLTGALPSGRRRGKPFTPGLTPSPACGAPLTEQIRQVAALDTEKIPNNIAFNVKLAPGGDDTHERIVDRMAAYARTYFDLGGMQLQFNVVSTETLRRAMEHPEEHRDLLVRISGYNAYFVELNRDLQLELVERAEHR